MVWGAVQLHLNFAAFIFGVPIFPLIVKFVGWRNRHLRYDCLARKCMKLTFAACSATALLRGALLFLFITLLEGFCPVPTAWGRCGHRHGSKAKIAEQGRPGWGMKRARRRTQGSARQSLLLDGLKPRISLRWPSPDGNL